MNTQNKTCRVTCGVCVCVWCECINSVSGSSSDKTEFHLKRGSDVLSARVRVWVISAVAAPNTSVAWLNGSSRTELNITVTMITLCGLYIAHIFGFAVVSISVLVGNSRIKLTCLATV